MADRGEVPEPPYGAALVLAHWVVNQWAEFDGWAVEHGVDLFALPLDRLFNLAYRLIVQSMDDDERRDFDQALAYADRQMADSSGAVEDDAPSWWRGEEAAYEDTMAVMGSMGRRSRRGD